MVIRRANAGDQTGMGQASTTIDINQQNARQPDQPGFRS
jgi:hypothetical protein